MKYPKKTFKLNLTPKLRLWLKAFLDESNPKAFLNKTGAARAAGYQCSKEDSFRQIGLLL